MYIVTARRDINNSNGVEVAGVFDSEVKANDARNKVLKWMEDNEYEDYEVFVTPIIVNQLNWYDIEENI